MAWLDERLWCHPKFTDLTAEAFRAYINGIAYASGMATRGRLTPQQQSLVGASRKVRNELVRAELWDENGYGIVIHDWDDHNAKRDARRAADRERKRLARAKDRETSPGPSAGTSAGQSSGASTGAARVDGSEGSDGSDRVKENPPNPNRSVDADERSRDDLVEAVAASRDSQLQEAQ